VKPFDQVFLDEILPYAMSAPYVHGGRKPKLMEMAGSRLNALESHAASPSYFSLAGDESRRFYEYYHKTM
jgi:hypothetical protein